jgi:hypothetical protein
MSSFLGTKIELYLFILFQAARKSVEWSLKISESAVLGRIQTFQKHFGLARVAFGQNPHRTGNQRLALQVTY